MDILVLVYIVAALLSFFVVGCLLGALFSDTFREQVARRLSAHPLSLKRVETNPILTPGTYPWTDSGVFNPAALYLAGRFHLLYRAVGKDGISRLGYAESQDGVSFTTHPSPAYEAPGVKRIGENMRRRMPPITSSGSGQGGAEDPRMVKIGERIYVTFNLYNGWNSLRTAVISISEADFLAKKFDAWQGPHLLSPEGAVNKNSVLFPEKINGKFALLHSLYGETDGEVRVAYADNIETFSEGKDFVSPDPGSMPSHQLAWHARMKSIGTPPVKTSRGWLVFYHAMTKEAPGRYTLGALLLDARDPTQVRYRAGFPVLVPEKAYERKGAQGIVYACGAVVKGDTLYVYYGGGDKTVCAATAPLETFVDEIVRSSRFASAPRHKNDERPLFTRHTANPILKPQGDGFESTAVLNPAAVELNGGVYLLYRAMDETNTSRLGLALTLNGKDVDERLPEPVYVPRAAFELPRAPGRGSGCEDPRVVHIDDRLYLTYVAYDGVEPPAGTLSSIALSDFMHRRFDQWSNPIVFTPQGVDDKDFALLPARVDGTYMLYHRIDNQLCADILETLDGSEQIRRCIEVLKPRAGMWDDWKVGIAAPPIEIEGGWLMLYHGVSRDRVYRVGAALLEPDGVTVRARTETPIFEPEEAYEKKPPVVFPCGAVLRDNDTLYIYYGAADKAVGVATAPLSRILALLS